MVDAADVKVDPAPLPVPALDPPAAPPPSPAAQLQKALDLLNHPSNLDLQSRIHAIQNCLAVMSAALMPLLPTE